MKKRKMKIVNKKRFIISLSLMIGISFAIIVILTSRNKVYSFEYEEKYIKVTVSKGDTLWSIASNNNPENYDIREIIYEIMIANDLKNSKVIPGDTIKIPIKTKK